MVPPCGLVNDIKKYVLRPCLVAAVRIGIWKSCGRTLVPAWGLVNVIKKEVLPPGPPYTLRCRHGDWYMTLKRICLPNLMCRHGDWYMILKRMCFLQSLPTLSGASVRKSLCILPSVWLIIGTCKALSIGA